MSLLKDKSRPTVVVQGSGNFVLVTYQAVGSDENETVAFRLFEAWPRPARWFGRDKEISELCQLIMSNSCPTVGILGPGGVGKSSLLSKLLEKLGDSGHKVDAILWRDIINHTNYDLFINGVIRELCQNMVGPAELGRLDEGERVSFLLSVLSSRKALIILDGLEALFASRKKQVGRCIDPRFERLFSRLTTVPHQSQIIFTSRETPYSLAASNPNYQPYYLSGLSPKAAVQMLRAHKIKGDEGLLVEISEKVEGSPFALEHIAALINEDLGGDALVFSRGDHRIPIGLEDLINHQMDRCGPIEGELVVVASIFRLPVSEQALAAVIEGTPKALWQALSNLGNAPLVCCWFFVDSLRLFGDTMRR